MGRTVMSNIDSPKRVLHVFMNLNLGGAESRIMDLFRSQDPNVLLNDFLIMTNEHCYFTDEVLTRDGKIHVIDSPRESILKNLWQLYLLLRRNPQYTAIHAHTSYYSGICVFIAFLAGVRSRVTHARNTDTGNKNLPTLVMFAVGRLLARFFATSRFAISSEAGDFLYGISPDKRNFEVIPNAFNFRKIKHKENISEQDKLDFCIDSRVLNIVCVGRFSPVKNHSFLIDLIAALATQTNDFCLHLIGDGELREELQDKVNELFLGDKVKFWGNRADVSKLLPMFDVMVMPSLSEGLGVAALEAQAAGVPCVLSASIPKEADIGCGLCRFLNLNLEFELWINAIQEQALLALVEKCEIDKQFEKRGYSLSSTRQRYLDAYLKHE